jgi:hypothetical protein
MPLEALNLLVTEERYRSLLYMPLYMFMHILLNVLVKTANKMGLKNHTIIYNLSELEAQCSRFPSAVSHYCTTILFI